MSVASNAELRGEWKYFPAFDANPISIIDVPGKVYCLAAATLYDEKVAPQSFLFSYDKEAQELLPMTKLNYLSGNLVSDIQYNPYRNYLLIAYDDGNIDLLYDDGSVVNIPALKLTEIAASKKVNSIRFDRERERIYLAADFGYLILDDKNGRVVESRIFDTNINTCARVDDKFLVGNLSGLYWIQDGDKAFTLNDFNKIPNIDTIYDLMPLDGNKFAYVSGNRIIVSEVQSNNVPLGNTIMERKVKRVNYSSDGYVLCWNNGMVRLFSDGTTKELTGVPSTDSESLVGTWDGTSVWTMVPQKGLRQYNYSDGKWTMTTGSVYPNTPTCYRSRFPSYSEKYGVLLHNHNRGRLFSEAITYGESILLSGYKDGLWTQYGYAYTNTDFKWLVTHGTGPAFDPDDGKYVYQGSWRNGIQRINLEDPKDMIFMSHPADANSSRPEYRKLCDDDPGWNMLCFFSKPQFDNAGYMWSSKLTVASGNKNTAEIWVWTPEGRKSADVSKFYHYNIPNIECSNDHTVLPLKASGNKNLLVYSNGTFDPTLIVIDTNGTPTDFTDDKRAVMTSLYDQDGSAINPQYVYAVYEDPSTGYVWVGYGGGVFYFNPKNAFTSPSRVNRVKISREDGTNLADYLLNNVTVTDIINDAQGHKWFATFGGGVVCTSSDGSKVIGTVDTDNSMLPSNNVYSLLYNPDNRSVMISTENGLTEFIPQTANSGDSDSSNNEARIYPNPVRPDYLGWVTIENLPENAVVKIVDATGNLVKELGFAENGTVRWDVTNSEMHRVASGVYHIFASSGPDAENMTAKGKVLVVN